MRILVVIPARGGSKGIPGKNIKELAGKPLIKYTVELARVIVSDENICVSTDSDEIKSVVEEFGLKVPFKRPDSLATDTAGTYEVLLHAIKYYEDKGQVFDCLLLLQPTSPLRNEIQVKEALSLFNPELDMVVSVKEASTNPYYGCYEEDENGFLYVSKGNGKIKRRQDAPKVWEYNGAIYIININSLKQKTFSEFERIIKYQMDDYSSMDLDTPLDWTIAELLMSNK
ncbi:MAG: acylneuraminate cytidylyltransferase family protein [Tannerellaceae bacterium]|nr:acylneuraminate cytidylyltransferase family protein [Tannerellaceae bacterium]